MMSANQFSNIMKYLLAIVLIRTWNKFSKIPLLPKKLLFDELTFLISLIFLLCDLDSTPTFVAHAVASLDKALYEIISAW